MKRKSLTTTPKLKALVQKNRGINFDVLAKSIEYVTLVRSMGLKGQGFNLLSSHETVLKLKGPLVHHI